MAKKIGVSLSFCISDICRGTVDAKDVALIYFAGRTTDWESVIAQYTQSCWAQFPGQATKLVRDLAKAGKLKCSQLQNPGWIPQLENSGDHWVANESEIKKTSRL